MSLRKFLFVLLLLVATACSGGGDINKPSKEFEGASGSTMLVDNLRIYSRELRSGEVKLLYNFEKLQ